MGLNLSSGLTTNLSKKPNQFNEPEGIFPDGKYTSVESSWQCNWLGGDKGSANIDIWKLKLDGSGNDFVRITNFNDYEGAKAANPVVSTDGRFMAFQSAKSSDPPGSGSGILIYWFKK
jgi:Tol biopolymer transport system component